MPVEVVTGDIFDDDAMILVNPVNCVGVMGSGLAKEFKRRWPGMFAEYERAFDNRRLYFGSILFGEVTTNEHEPRWVCCVPTKNHWRWASTLGGVEFSLHALRFWIGQDPGGCGTSVAMPALGCGLGGLDFDDVLPLIRRYFDDAPYPVRVYRPR